MHPYASLILQNYYKAIGWNEDNLYSNLTRASNGSDDMTLYSRIPLNASALQQSSILRSQVGYTSKSRRLLIVSSIPRIL